MDMVVGDAEARLAAVKASYEAELAAVRASMLAHLYARGTTAWGIVNVNGQVAENAWTGSDGLTFAMKYAEEVNGREHAVGKPWVPTEVVVLARQHLEEAW